MNLPTDHDEPDRDDTDRELDRAYARASLADGSRPSPSARASILATAQREAAARATQTAGAGAANDSLWSWRAAAGLAGIAFVGVMALWLYRENPRPMPVAATLPARPMQLDMPPPPAPPADSTPPPSNVEAAPQTRPKSRQQAAPQTQSRQQQPASDARAQAAARAGSGNRLEEVVVTGGSRAANAAAPASALESAPTREPQPEPALAASAAPPPDAPPATAANRTVRTMAAPFAASRAQPSPTELLQRWFPQALDSSADGQQYWFVLDRTGAVTRSGQRAWNDLAELQRWLESGAGAPRIERVESAHVSNSRGRDVELAYAWTRD